MKETVERVIRIGLKRDVRKVFDEIESVSAEMIRKGWKLQQSCLEECLGSVHLFFERTLDESSLYRPHTVIDIKSPNKG
jgi:hypothetical protein